MTMFNNKLVACIKAAGKVLREQKDQVRIPFGSEYSIYIKNLNSVRALVKVEIDGRDIGDGTRFIVQPNNNIEIERYLNNGNLTEGNRFKFIERTARIEDARGVGAEDGLIRVEFQFEKVVKQTWDDAWKKYETEIHHHHHYPPKPYWWNDGYGWYGNSSQTIGSSGGSYSAGPPVKLKSSGTMRGIVSNNIQGSANAFVGNASFDAASVNVGQTTTTAQNENGITVAGSVSEQKFQHGAWFATETETHVLVLKIVGSVEGNVVYEPVTVKAKCTTCNHLNKATAKFCSECGTSLVIV